MSFVTTLSTAGSGTLVNNSDMYGTGVSAQVGDLVLCIGVITYKALPGSTVYDFTTELETALPDGFGTLTTYHLWGDTHGNWAMQFIAGSILTSLPAGDNIWWFGNDNVPGRQITITHAAVFRGAVGVPMVPQVPSVGVKPKLYLPVGISADTGALTWQTGTRFGDSYGVMAGGMALPVSTDAVDAGTIPPNPVWSEDTYRVRTITAANADKAYTYSWTASVMMLGNAVVVDSSAPRALQPIIRTANPTLSTPGISYQTANLPFGVTWWHRKGVTGVQQAYVLRRVSTDGTKYWDAAAQSWSATEVTNNSPINGVTFPASAGYPGQQMTISVKTKGVTATAMSDWSEPVTVRLVLPPAVQVDVVGRQPTGVVADQSPEIVVTGIPYAPAWIVGWEAELYLGVERKALASGEGNPGSWTVPGEVVQNNTTYTARGRVQQIDGSWSTWATRTFKVQVVAPGAPTVTVSYTEHPDSKVPGARVTAMWDAATDPYPWASQYAVMYLERKVDDGPWRQIGVVRPGIGTTVYSWFDYTPPADLPVQYRVRARAVTVDGGLVMGEYGTSRRWVLFDACGWIVDFNRPERSVRVRLTSENPGSWTGSGGARRVIGARTAVVTYGSQHTPIDGSLTVVADDPAHVDRLIDLLWSPDLMLVRFASEVDRYGDRHPAVGVWMRVVGDVRVTRQVRGPYSQREVEFSYVRQDEPGEVSE